METRIENAQIDGGNFVTYIGAGVPMFVGISVEPRSFWFCRTPTKRGLAEHQRRCATQRSRLSALGGRVR
jgi:hypothetical protein